jgi:MYXO-CTERM domain-containing protein
MRIDSLPQDAEGWAEVTVGDLSPGSTYDIAFCSNTAITGDTFVLWNMSWEIGDEEGTEEGETTATTTGEDAGGSEVGSAGFGDDGRPNEAGNIDVGCACAAQPGGPLGGGFGLLVLLGLRPRRRCSSNFSLGRPGLG